MPSSNNLNQERLWQEMCFALRKEIQARPHKSCEKTIQELFAKHPDFRRGRPVPTLDVSARTIRTDDWPLAELVGIAKEGQLKPDTTWRPDLAVILVQRYEDYYLIDGGHRIANWNRDDTQQKRTCRVLIIDGSASRQVSAAAGTAALGESENIAAMAASAGDGH
jgi:hypothetical protein